MSGLATIPGLTSLVSSTPAHGKASAPGGALGSAPGRATAPDWRALDAALAGSVHLPGDAGYAHAHQVNDPRFDTTTPPAVIRCADVNDVAEAVRFANRFDVQLTTRSGGNSYVGASTSARAAVLDLRTMRNIRVGPGYATIGSGATVLDIFTTLNAHGVSAPLGACGGVGFGGLTLGGGMGMTATEHGLTCDQVTAVTLVTAQGTVREVSDGDLLWACKGGGGAGAVVACSWNIRTHPTADVDHVELRYNRTHALAALAGWQRRFPAHPVPAWSQAFLRDGGVTIVIFCRLGRGPDGATEAEAMIRSIGRDPDTRKQHRRTHIDTVNYRVGDMKRNVDLLGSDIFRQPLPEAGLQTLLRLANDGPGDVKVIPLTGAIARPGVNATAFAWRSASFLGQWRVQPGTTDPGPVAQGYRWIRHCHDAVAQWSVGRYLNYMEPDGPKLALGPHAERLRRIRAQHDPDRRFAMWG